MSNIDAVNRVVRAGLGPLLRADGFRVKGRNYRRTIEAGPINVVNVHLSAGSPQFVLELGVRLPAVEALLGNQVLEAPTYDQCTLQLRLGPQRQGLDPWFALVPEDEVAAEVATVWETVGRAAMERAHDPHLVPSDGKWASSKPLGWAAIALVAGDRERAALSLSASVAHVHRGRAERNLGPTDTFGAGLLTAVERFAAQHGLAYQS